MMIALCVWRLAPPPRPARPRLGDHAARRCWWSHRGCSAPRPWRRTSTRRWSRRTSASRWSCWRCRSTSGARSRAPKRVGAEPSTPAPRLRRLALARRRPCVLHDRRRRLHGGHAELRPRRLPARRRRPPRLRQGVPDLQRRRSCRSATRARRHPPHPPRLHLPRDACSCSRWRDGPCAARQPERRCATPGSRSALLGVQLARRRAQRLARRVRGADRAPPRRSARCCGDTSSGSRLQLYRVPSSAAAAPSAAAAEAVTA